MTNSEPTDVGPVAGGDRDVSEGDRQHVITLLNAAHAEGRLSVIERDRRSIEARQALIFDDLVPLTRDLVATTSQPSFDYDQSDPSKQTDQVVAIFGGTERSGRWRVRAHTAVTALFGGVVLNMAEATFEAKEITVEVFCMFGGVELKVPEGTEVDNRLAAVFGGCDHKVGPASPDGPRVVVKGFTGFGGVEIRNPKQSKRKRS